MEADFIRDYKVWFEKGQPTTVCTPTIRPGLVRRQVVFAASSVPRRTRKEGIDSSIRCGEKRRHWQPHKVRMARASTAPSGAARSEGVGGPTRRSRCWRLKTDTSIISFCLSFCLYTPPPGPHDTALIKLSTTVQSYLCS